jgi:hypothetical protein
MLLRRNRTHRLTSSSCSRPLARSRPFGTSALRSRRLHVQASRPPADVRNFERYLTVQDVRQVTAS